ncbi:hypothetical protein SB766_31290, partial [Pseudomonas sp. SIMBA_077]
QQLYRQRSAFGANLLSFVLAGFPRLVRQEWRLVLLASLLFFPRSVMAMVAGLVFGVWWGGVLAAAGSVIGASTGFLLTR